MPESVVIPYLFIIISYKLQVTVSKYIYSNIIIIIIHI